VALLRGNWAWECVYGYTSWPEYAVYFLERLSRVEHMFECLVAKAYVEVVRVKREVIMIYRSHSQKLAAIIVWDHLLSPI